MNAAKLAPVLYLPHGGGPLPLLGDPQHASLTTFLQKIPAQLGRPSAIVLISAHWEEECATLTSGAQPELIYDYYGFPPESYDIQYPAPGEPQLAQQIASLLNDRDINVRLDEQRGFDHGMFVPLKLMYPDAQIPVVQLSLLKNLDPAAHITLGMALSELRREDILIIGSGLSYHNLRALLSRTGSATQEDVQFDQWLTETCTNPELSADERKNRLTAWEQAPFARQCHPREEHLLPLHVCYGIAAAQTPVATQVYSDRLMGKQVSAYLW